MPFGRLMGGIAEGWERLEKYKPMIVQAGSTKVGEVPNWVRVIDFCGRQEVEGLLRESKFCITHGGTGSIVGAIKAGCKVAVMPRLKAYGEHNDDHQVEIAELFEETGLVVYWRESMSVGDVLGRLEEFEPVEYLSEFGKLRESIAADVAEFLGKPGGWG